MVNSNNPTSKVLAGQRAELQALMVAALEQGTFKTVLLGADLPYHHPLLLAGATPLLAEFLHSLPWTAPHCPVVSTIDGRLVQAPEELLALTARNIATPIDWQRAVQTLATEGITLALECGAGLALTQNARLISPSPAFVSLKQAQQRLGL